MIGFGSQVEIRLDVARFANDEETMAIASVVAEHAEKRRAEFRQNEKPIKRGLLGIEGNWSDTVPWYEWIADPQVLQPCADQCGLKIWQLAGVIAYQIRPENWQVFSWMGVALQGSEYEQLVTGALSHQTARIANMREEQQALARTNFAKAGAAGKLAADPKQRDKASVRECWDEWQKQPIRYRSKAAFARDMRDKFVNLESQPVIEGWCRTWERET